MFQITGSYFLLGMSVCIFSPHCFCSYSTAIEIHIYYQSCKYMST